MTHDPFYWSVPWREFRAAFLAAHPRCTVPGCDRLATVVDHIIRRSAGGASLDPANCRALCAQHHNRKSREHDQPRKTGDYRHVTPGSTADGSPIDPDHPWHK